MTTTTKYGIATTRPDLAPGQAFLYIGTPCHTITPYDRYARLMADDASRALRRAGIPAEVTINFQRLLSPTRSGPEGAIRFGDDMTPPEVAAIVATEDLDRARDAWETHTLRKYCQKPFHLTRGAYWTGKKWQAGPTWPMVIANAIATACVMQMPLDRLVRYAARHGVTLRPPTPE